MPAFLDWLEARAANGTVTKTMAQALDDAPPPDNTAPTSSIACNGAACSGGSYYAPSVQVSLSATDNAGGSGVASIRYTTDGSTPSQSSTAYTAPFTVSSTTTVKYRAYDNQGNAESTHSQTINIDSSAPSSTITCNGAACSGAWHAAAVQVALSATDSGSGLASIRYTTDGSTPSLASAAYSTPFTLSSTKTVKFRAYDNVGNAESTNTQAVDVDTVAPATSIKCNGKACSSGWYNAAVKVSLAGDRHGLRRRRDPLHDRRLDAHAREPRLRRAVHLVGEQEREVPGRRPRGQPRRGQDHARAHRHD